MRVLLILVGLSGFLFSQHKTYKMVPDSTIDNYVKEADAVVLIDENIISVSASEIEFTVNRKLRINNESGAIYDRVTVYETELISVSGIEAKTTDLFGNLIAELDDDDIEESILASGYLVKTKVFKGFGKSYPYIIEYSYTYEYSSHFFWPDWMPQKDIPVLFSSYKLILENDIAYKTHKIGFDFPPYIYEEDGDIVHLYSLQNIPPLDYESHIPNEFLLQNAILFAPINFELGESAGSFATWDDMARWIYSLYNDHFNLPDNVNKEIAVLIDDVSDPYKQIEILYKYLQEKTRYVQVYLDIGGWQPHSSEWVYNNRFGDCKDLTTFMIAMLKIADIEAYPALVRTKDSGYVYKEFPSNQFNHAITFIPLPDDTLWVDCTLDYTSYKDIPYVLEGTNALIIKENSGKIIKIPQRNSSENLKFAIIKGLLKMDGSLKLSGNIKTKGSIKNYYMVDIAILKKDELRLTLLNEFTRYQPNFSLQNFAFQHDNTDESLTVLFFGEFEKFSKKVGKRIFLNPNILNRATQNYMPDAVERTYPFDLVKYPYLDIDSLEIKLPRNFSIESAPEMKNIVYPFGKYMTSYRIENGIFYYKRLFEYSVELIYPEEFSDFLYFYKTAVETDRSRFVFKVN